MRARNAIVARFGHPLTRFRAGEHPARINLGAGSDKRPGYLNVDLQKFHNPDLVSDVRSLPELPSAFYEEIVAQDVLEHLAREDGPAALSEWRRLLAPGGRICLRVPDPNSLLRGLAESDDPGRHRDIMHHLYGTQAYDGDYRLAGYTDVMLCDQLLALGLERVSGELRDEWRWEIDAFAPGATEPVAPVAVVWGRGFYPRELNATGPLRWAAARSELLLCTAGEPLEVELDVTLETGEATIYGAGVYEWLGPGAHSVTLRLEPGANRLRFASEHRVRAAGDRRELAFRLSHAALGHWACL